MFGSKFEVQGSGFGARPETQGATAAIYLRESEHEPRSEKAEV
jgi:hypothetical protein